MIIHMYLILKYFRKRPLILQKGKADLVISRAAGDNNCLCLHGHWLRCWHGRRKTLHWLLIWQQPLSTCHPPTPSDRVHHPIDAYSLSRLCFPLPSFHLTICVNLNKFVQYYKKTCFMSHCQNWLSETERISHTQSMPVNWSSKDKSALGVAVVSKYFPKVIWLILIKLRWWTLYVWSDCETWFSART